MVQLKINGEVDNSFENIIKSIEDESIKSLLLLYLFMIQVDPLSHCCPPINESHNLGQEIKINLDKEWISEAQYLCKLLDDHHFNAVLNAYEAVASKAYEPVYYSSDQDEVKSIQNLNDLDDNLRIKIVKIIKYHEPLGATVQLNEITGDVYVSRIIHDGAAYRSGMINVGDIIHEVNGFTLKELSFPSIIQILEEECRNDTVSFKIIAGDYCDKKDYTVESKVRVKALFDYNPDQDEYHPCPEAGLSFRKGDILHIVNLEDPNWWQAKPELEQPVEACFASYYRAGIIPSKQLQEKRFAELRDLRQLCFINSLKKRYGFAYKMKKNLYNFRKVKKLMYRAFESDEFEHDDIQTYIEVDKLKPKPGQYRPLILIDLKNESNQLLMQLVARVPTLFEIPILHTTRSPAKDEAHGYDYFFVDKEWFLNEIEKGQFIDYKKIDDDFFGTHIKTIEDVIQNGRICLLSPPIRSIKLLYNQIFKPFIVFLKPKLNYKNFQNCPKFKNLESTDYWFFKFQKETNLKAIDILTFRLEYLYGHYFDLVIVNEDEAETIEKLLNVVKRVNTTEQWVPSSWTTFN